MDVSEVDAAELIQGTVSGGETGLGAHAGLMGTGAVVTFPNGSGAISGSEISAHSGAVAGSVAYQESPTIRYFPLSGQALVAQIATPISVTSLANLSTATWPWRSVLEFALLRATPNYMDQYAAINAMVALDDYYGALMVAATKSDATKPEPPTPQRVDGTNITVQSAPPAEQATDSLTLYLQPDHPDIPNPQPAITQTTCSKNGEYLPRLINYDETGKNELLAKQNIMHLWIRLLRLYRETQADPSLKKYTDEKLKNLDENVNRLDMQELNKQFDELANKIELRSSQVPLKKKQPTSPATDATGTRNKARNKGSVGTESDNISPASRTPVIETVSALGILLKAKDQPIIQFLNFDLYNRVKDGKQNKNATDVYILTKEDLEILKNSGFEASGVKIEDPILECVSSWIVETSKEEYRAAALHDTFSIQADVNNYEAMKAEHVLGKLRRYLLIIETPPGSNPPSDAFVSYPKGGKTYYIDRNDKISQKNFALLSQFMTMQAVPPTTAPLTPTISVGAGG